MKFGTIDVKGKTFNVEVNSGGQFSAVHEGSEAKANTLEELKTKLAGWIARSKVKVNIPFVRYQEATWRNEKAGVVKGTITGIHAGNRNLLVQFDGQKGVEQESSYSSRQYIDPAMAEELMKLGTAMDLADKAYRKFVEKHKFDGTEAVKKALGNGAAEVLEGDED